MHIFWKAVYTNTYANFGTFLDVSNLSRFCAFIKGAGGSDDNSASSNSSEDNGDVCNPELSDCIADPDVDPDPKHVTQLIRDELVLTSDVTTTGLGKHVLGVKTSFLVAGNTYLVEVAVTHQGTCFGYSTLHT